MASRGKHRASRASEAEGVAGAPRPVPLPGWRVVVGRPAFRASAVRQALPVIGVFFLQWPALDVIAFFLLEVWLFLTLRVALEFTLDRAAARDLPTRRLVADFLRHAFWSGVAFVLLVGMIVLVTVAVAFSKDQLLDFVMRGWRSPSFLVALVVMVSSHAWEARDFAERCRGRSEEDRLSDDRRLHVVFARVLVVSLAGMFLGLAQAFGVGGQVLVLVISGAIVWLDASPERAEALLGATPSRAA